MLQMRSADRQKETSNPFLVVKSIEENEMSGICSPIYAPPLRISCHTQLSHKIKKPNHTEP